MKKILIFTAGFGEGHNTAANSLCAAFCHTTSQGEAEARVIDLFAECYGLVNKFACKAYIGLINRAPEIWQSVYRWLDESTALEANMGVFSRVTRRLAQIIEQEKPDVVVSTYPAYNYLLSRIYADGRPRGFAQITIVTDSITVNSVWYRAGSDYFIVPNEDTGAVMRGKGVAGEKIKVLGFPVTHRFFTESVVRQPPVEGNRRVLFMINSVKGEAPNLVRCLLEIPGIQLTVTVGRDAGLRAAVEKVVAASGRTVEIHGWTDKLPNLLMGHHLLISKAGGATVQETIAAKTPMLIMQVVPGQEEGNARLLLDHDCGALTETSGAIVKTVAEIFRNGTQVWEKWERNIAGLSKPDAALVIARFILDLKQG
jgi:UDP-N-acetylglucosamine:LPS N-acetylglucosamine transferase